MAVRRTLLRPLARAERSAVAEALREETLGGALLLLGALVALVWANTPWQDTYETLRGTTLGPSGLDLDLTAEKWASDGLLAIFFLVAGLELKRELVLGHLRKPSEAVLPVVAAVAGMAIPAVVYLAMTRGQDGTAGGWAIPMATDIAFALAVLAVVGRALPTALRAFLLTLAVVDDLGAILVIALFYTSELAAGPLLGAAALLALYAWLQRRRVSSAWVYLPLAVAVWALVHASGVHATVAGVAIGLLTRVHRDGGEHESPAEVLEHRMRPISAGVAVPLFALFAAGITVSGDTLSETVDDPATLGIVAGLLIGKPLGVFGGTWLVARWTRASLSPELSWSDVLAVGVLSGIGFTVSLLIGDLAFSDDPERTEHVKAAVLAGSLLAAFVASLVLRARHRSYRDAEEAEDEEESLPDER